VLLSVASAWEMQIKLQLGKLVLRSPLAEVIASQEQTNDLQVLPVTLRHVLALQGLPAHHKDPLDRRLIVQANVEEATLMTHDPIFARYPVPVLW
jgi:PIN domain nuclease of toxin-antitoxin system